MGLGDLLEVSVSRFMAVSTVQESVDGGGGG